MEPRVWRLRILGGPSPGRGHVAVQVRAARLLGLSAREARHFLGAAPQLFPRELEGEEALRLQAALRSAGVAAERIEVPRARGRCVAHPTFVDEALCVDCGAALCSVCRTQGPGPLCLACAGRRKGRERRRGWRVAVLLAIGTGLVVGALAARQRRASRGDWERTLRVAVVLSAPQPVAPAVREAARKGLTGLEAQLDSEFHRYREGPSPFHFVLYGPLALAEAPPSLALTPRLWDRARAAFRTWRFQRQLWERVGESDAFDVTLLVVLLPDAVQTVEGVGEEGGDFGVVDVPMGDAASALSLTALAHELLHCLGATDKYDAGGHARVPEGLAEPEREPRYPQRFTEVMVGESATGPGTGRIPLRVEELRVGPATAVEIRWAPTAR